MRKKAWTWLLALLLAASLLPATVLAAGEHTVTFKANGRGGDAEGNLLVLTVPAGDTINDALSFNDYDLLWPAPVEEDGKRYEVDSDYYTDPECTVAADMGAPPTGDMILYAKWQECRKVTVTFDTKGGTPVPDQEVYINDPARRPADPYKGGHAFAGWYFPLAKDLYDFEGPLEVDIMLEAVWEQDDSVPLTCTVSFETYGGAPAPAAQTVDYGHSAAAPAQDPVKGGHVFGGWFADTLFSQPFDFSAPVLEDTTVYARWLPCAASLEGLDFGGAAVGYEQPDNRIFRVEITGGADLVNDSDHYRLAFSGDTDAFSLYAGTGGTFAAGNTYNAGSARPNAGLAAGSYTVTATLSYDIDGPANGHGWQVLDTAEITFTVNPAAPVTCTVSFDGNGGSGTMADVTVNAGEDYVLPTCGFTAAEGTEFDCWAIGGISREPGFTVVNITADVQVTACWKDAETPPTYGVSVSPAGVTLTAREGYREEDLYRTVTAASTGTGEVEFIMAGFKEASMYDHFTFIVGGMEVTVAPRAGLKAGTYTAVVMIEDFEDRFDPIEVPVTFTVTAAPSPEKDTCAISYDLGGGTLNGKTGVVTVQLKKGAVITMPRPSRAGYTFDYWEGSRYYAGDRYTVTGDHTFTARWTANTGADPVPAPAPGNPDGRGTGATPIQAGPSGTVTAPRTADGSHLTLWTCLAAASSAGLALAANRGRSRKRRG